MPERLRAILAHARNANDAGDFAAATRRYFEAADKALSVELSGELAYCLRHGAQLALDTNAPRLALDAAEEAARIYDELESARGLNYANSARLIALAKEGLGLVEEARPLWSEARAIYDLNGVKDGVAECDAHLAG